MTEYQLKPGKLGKKVMNVYKKVEEKFTDTFLEKDENSPTGYSLKTGKTAEKVTGAYQKIEDSVVGTYKKIENAFVDKFLEEKKINNFQTKLKRILKNERVHCGHNKSKKEMR